MIYNIGEALIDFIPSLRGVTLEEVPEFRRVVGGGPANCCTAVARLGGESAFIGQVGDDAFGRLILPCGPSMHQYFFPCAALSKMIR